MEPEQTVRGEVYRPLPKTSRSQQRGHHQRSCHSYPVDERGGEAPLDARDAEPAICKDVMGSPREHSKSIRSISNGETTFPNTYTPTSFMTDIQYVLPSFEASCELSTAMESLRSTIPADSVAYWSSLSVRVAVAVMKANGSERVVQKAVLAVLDAGKKTRSATSLRSLAAQVSSSIIVAGGSHEVAAAATVAIMTNEEEDDPSVKDSCLRPKIKKDAKSNKRGMKSFSTHDPPAVDNPSMTVQRRQLMKREDKILHKSRELDKKEMLNRQKEKELSERIAALDAEEASLQKNMYTDYFTPGRMLLKEDKLTYGQENTCALSSNMGARDVRNMRDYLNELECREGLPASNDERMHTTYKQKSTQKSSWLKQKSKSFLFSKKKATNVQGNSSGSNSQS